MKMASWSSVSEHLVNPIGMSDQLKWNNQIVEAIKEYIRKRIEKEQELDIQKFNIVADFYIPGILSVYMNWFMNNHNISIEELSHILTDLILHGTEKK